MESKVLRAWVTVADLAEGAASEDCRLRSARTILEAAGELSPTETGPRLPGTAIQIIIGTGPDRREVRLSDGQVSGVIEAEPYSPTPAVLPGSDDD